MVERMSDGPSLRTTELHLEELVADADRASLVAPGHRWEGRLDGAFGSVSKASFAVTATLRFEADGVEGEGHAGAKWRGFRVNGWIRRQSDATGDEGAGVGLDLWFDEEPLSGAPFSCLGAFSGDGRRIEGKWFVDCLFPDDCACDGGGGEFWLQRVG